MLALLTLLLAAAPPARPLPCTAPGVTPPSAIGPISPDLRELPRRGVAPLIFLKVTVTGTGRVESVTVVRGARRDFNDRIIKAVAAAKFRPAKRNGKPVRCVMDMQVRIEVR
jgi:TonB family protein